MARSSTARIRRPPLRSLTSVVALAVALAVVGYLVSKPGGLLGPPRPSPGLAEALRQAGTGGRPIVEATSARCFSSAPSVAMAQRHGDEVLVRFTGRSRIMRIQYERSEDAALRWAYDHRQPSNIYDNTNWFGAPTRLTAHESDALSTCLPLPKDP